MLSIHISVIIFPSNWLENFCFEKSEKSMNNFPKGENWSFFTRNPLCLFKGWWFEINVMRLDVMRFPKREIKNDWTRFTDFSSPTSINLNGNPLLRQASIWNYPCCFKPYKKKKWKFIVIYRHCTRFHQSEVTEISFTRVTIIL